MCHLQHGPAAFMDDCDYPYESRPDYGFTGEAAVDDPYLRARVTADDYNSGAFRVGTLAEQFPMWWSHYGELDELNLVSQFYGNARYIPALRSHWYACRFEVPDEHVVIGRQQVLFRHAKATLLDKTQTLYPR